MNGSYIAGFITCLILLTSGAFAYSYYYPIEPDNKLVCLFFTCLSLNPELYAQLYSEHSRVGVDEFVGYVDGNVFDLEGIQSTNGKIISLNKHCKQKGVMIHSHPKTFNSLYGVLCLPSEKDLKAKKIFGNKTQYLYCGNNYLVVY